MKNWFNSLMSMVYSLFRPKPSSPVVEELLTDTTSAPTAVIVNSGVKTMKKLPSGRGWWIWHLKECEGGNLDKLIKRCQECHITWLAIKAGNAGDPWEKQFTKAMVAKLKSGGIRVFGWSYDMPNKIDDQVKVAQFVSNCGADGFIIDAEVEWERTENPDAKAREYVQKLRAALPESFLIGDAPWPVINYHQKFPFTAFSEGLDFRCPQNYWPENCLSVESATERYLSQWEAFEGKKPERARPRLASGYSIKPDSGCKPATLTDMLKFEKMIKDAGETGCLYWVYDRTPTGIFEGLKGKPF